MLSPLDLSFRQTVVACVVLSIWFPCVATFAVMLRELGGLKMLKASAIMALTALTVGTLMNLVLKVAVGY
jgi:ferrous iron transport protein B